VGHWKQYMESEHLGAWDLCYPDGPKKGQPAPYTGEIVKVVQGQVGAKRQKKPLVYLAGAPGGKAFVANTTNCKLISNIVGSPDPQDWIGHAITIYPTTTEMAGETVPCIRVDKKPPQRAQQKPAEVKP